jgi:hypothetical protein
MDNLVKTTTLLNPIAKTNVFDYIGFYAPDAVAVIVGILLLNQVKFLAVYILFFFINQWINRTLKDNIKQPRPTGSRPLVGESYPKTSYGMPSYHAQKIIFAITFLYLVKQNVHFLLVGLFIAGLTIFQRWKYRAHSVAQLATGAALGASIAYFGYFITNQYLRRIKDKPLIL